MNVIITVILLIIAYKMYQVFSFFLALLKANKECLESFKAMQEDLRAIREILETPPVENLQAVEETGEFGIIKKKIKIEKEPNE